MFLKEFIDIAKCLIENGAEKNLIISIQTIKTEKIKKKLRHSYNSTIIRKDVEFEYILSGEKNKGTLY